LFVISRVNRRDSPSVDERHEKPILSRLLSSRRQTIETSLPITMHIDSNTRVTVTTVIHILSL